jgi:hypothetical protein
MDQSPLAFEFLKGKTYAKRGERTILLKGAKSGWDKRQCTLQIYVSADRVACCKPLMMFKGKPKGDYRRRAEAKKYHPSVVVIFNEKAYANTSNLIDWVKNQYSIASAYPLCNNEPRFLSLDAFAPHKNKGQKGKAKESQKAMEKRLEEEKLQQKLRDEFAKLNVTISIIPGGCTSYVQVLDVTVNKIIKQYIEEAKNLWVDKHFDEWKAGKYTVGDRRILLTQWVGYAWEQLHLHHQDAIIKTFQNVGLALPTDGSKDHLLKIRDLSNITVGDWHQAPKGTEENPVVIPNDVSDSIEVENGLLYTAQEVEEGVVVKAENEDDITTDTGDESDTRFDYDSESDFDDELDGDEDEEDEDME